jgi:multimeric flavodoxin WrbA
LNSIPEKNLGRRILISVMKKILAVSGSTRKDSTNEHLINAIAEITREWFKIQPYLSISALPHFNPDLVDDAGTEVNEFRALILESDAILICAPEYDHGVRGSLKNAVDWTVGSSDFSGKIVILITACFAKNKNPSEQRNYRFSNPGRYKDCLEQAAGYVNRTVHRKVIDVYAHR